MRYDDQQWFYTGLKDNKIAILAQQAFRTIHGSDKKPDITLDVLKKNLDIVAINRNKKALDKLDKVVDQKYASLVRYCTVVYANFCDEIYAGLDDFYFQSINTEWLLHSESGYTGGRYRDHLTHQLKVTLLGVDFLQGKENIAPLSGHIVDALRKSQALDKYLKGEGITEDTITNDLVMAAWLLAGMFHDIGYCFVMHIKTAKQLSAVSKFFEHDMAADIWKKVESRLTEHSYIVEFYRRHGEGLDNSSSLENVKEIIRLSAFEGINHSVVGALYLLHMLGKVEEDAKKAFEDIDFKRKMRLVFELAALAVLTHDVDCPDKQGNGKKRFFKDTLEIPFHDFPLSYLLGVCDQLQDWGRRRTVRKPNESGSCLEMYIVDCEALDINLQGRQLTVRFCTPNTSQEGHYEPSYSFFGGPDPIKLRSISIEGPDLKALYAPYRNGRAYILNFVYGKCPLWDTFSLSTETGGTTFSPADYYSSTAAKKLIAQ